MVGQAFLSAEMPAVTTETMATRTPLNEAEPQQFSGQTSRRRRRRHQPPRAPQSGQWQLQDQHEPQKQPPLQQPQPSEPPQWQVQPDQELPAQLTEQLRLCQQRWRQQPQHVVAPHRPPSPFESSDDLGFLAGDGEAEPLCPQPRRAFVPFPVTPQPERPGSPCSPDHLGQQELRELMSGTKPGWLDADRSLESPLLSTVSTSAGPTPSIDEMATVMPWPLDFGDRPASAQSTLSFPDSDAHVADNYPSRSEEATLPAQDRKVFVGGVPQDLGQDELYAIFSEYAGVKKAWLQKCRTTNASGPCAPQNHRGFGFIIFHEAAAVEKLLGNRFSRFIVLRTGRRLEVKRALSSNKITLGPSWQREEGSSAASSRRPSEHNHVPPQASSPPLTQVASWQGCPLPRSPGVSVSEPAASMPTEAASSPSQGPSWSLSQVGSGTWIQNPDDATPRFSSMMRVGGPLESPSVSVPAGPQTLLGVVPASPAVLLSGLPLMASESSRRHHPSMEHSPVDWETILLQAMPDHYDD
jgi:hypothetical protein